MNKILYILVIIAIFSFSTNASITRADTGLFDVSSSYELSDSDLFQLQQFLYVEGYISSLPVDDLSDVTTNAVSAFQKDNNLEVTGYFDVKTIELINSKISSEMAYTPTVDQINAFNAASLLDSGIF